MNNLRLTLLKTWPSALFITLGLTALFFFSHINHSPASVSAAETGTSTQAADDGGCPYAGKCQTGHCPLKEKCRSSNCGCGCNKGI